MNIYGVFVAAKPVPVIIIAAAAALLGLVVASWWWGPQRKELQSGTLLQQPREVPDFQLTADNGRPFTKAQLQGHWTIVFPGFTSCPDICPTTLAFLKTLTAAMQGDGRNLGVVFLSVDPARDTPERMAGYVHYFNPAFVGVTAQEPELGRLAQALGIAYVKVAGATPETYTMDHSAALVLLDPQARITAYFSPPFRLDALRTDLDAVMRNRR